MKNLRNITLLLLVLIAISPTMAESSNVNDPVSVNNPVPVNNPVQAPSITGKVVDNYSGETLAGVLVTVEGTALQAYTDLDGQFSISGMNPGKYNLVLSLISYKKSLVENLEVLPGKEEAVEVKLNND